MDTQSLALHVDAIERELQRLRAARPKLESRIERAENILVTQLSVSNGIRPIRVRLHSDGSHSYRVRSGSKLSREYVVEPESWSCTCPDARRHTCKHVISVYALHKATQRGQSRRAGSTQPRNAWGISFSNEQIQANLGRMSG